MIDTSFYERKDLLKRNNNIMVYSIDGLVQFGDPTSKNGGSNPPTPSIIIRILIN